MCLSPTLYTVTVKASFLYAADTRDRLNPHGPAAAAYPQRGQTLTSGPVYSLSAARQPGPRMAMRTGSLMRRSSSVTMPVEVPKAKGGLRSPDDMTRPRFFSPQQRCVGPLSCSVAHSLACGGTFLCKSSVLAVHLQCAGGDLNICFTYTLQLECNSW